VPLFIVFQIVGAALGTAVAVTLYPDAPQAADAVVVRQHTRPQLTGERTTR
jgi:glycerol uptake facilitator-like aquaporin